MAKTTKHSGLIGPISCALKHSSTMGQAVYRSGPSYINPATGLPVYRAVGMTGSLFLMSISTVMPEGKRQQLYGLKDTEVLGIAIRVLTGNVHASYTDMLGTCYQIMATDRVATHDELESLNKSMQFLLMTSESLTYDKPEYQLLDALSTMIKELEWNRHGGTLGKNCMHLMNIAVLETAQALFVAKPKTSFEVGNLLKFFGTDIMFGMVVSQNENVIDVLDTDGDMVQIVTKYSDAFEKVHE